MYGMPRASIFIAFLCAVTMLDRAAVSPGADQSAPERPPITGLAHVAFLVSDLMKAEAFYGRELGFDHLNPPKPASAATTYYRVNDQQFVQIYPGLKGDEDRLLSIAFRTSDARKMRDYLAGKGLNVPHSIRQAADGTMQFTVEDPEGRRIEFVQYPQRGVQSIGKSSSSVSGRVIHAGFVVHDRTAEDRFYRDILGFQVMWFGGMKDDQVNWVDMRVPDGDDWLEYMLGYDHPSVKTRGVMNHFALGVKDIHAADRLIMSRVTSPPEQPKIGRDGKWQLNLYDPDLTRVELMEFKPVETPCCSPMKSR